MNGSRQHDGNGQQCPSPDTLAEADGEVRAEIALVNDRPGLIVDDSSVLGVFSFTVDADRIVAIDVVRNPDKLRHVHPFGGSTANDVTALLV